jgi:hypothetical protein
MNRFATDKLKHITPQEFVRWGMPDLAYIRPVIVNGGKAYAIHAADGTPMAVMPDLAVAQAAALQNDLEPLTVH